MPQVDPVEPSPELPERADVVVIGGGIVGAATAYALAGRGVSVALCEKGEIGAEQSARNWGFCRSQGRDPAEIPLMRESLDIWRGFARETGEDVGFRETGLIYLAENQARLELFERRRALCSAHGLAAEILSPAEVKARLPHSAAAWAGAIHTPNDGRAEPSRAAPAFARAAQRAGAAVLTRCAVRGLESEAGRVSAAVTERGRIATSAAVIAGGAWSSLFCRRHEVIFPQLQVLSSVLRTAPMEEIFAGGLWSHDFAFRRRLDGGYSVAPGHFSVFDLTPELFRQFRAFLPAWRQERDGMKLRFGRRFFTDLATDWRWSFAAESPFERCRVLDPAPYAPALERTAASLQAAFPAFAKVPIVERWAGMIDATPDAVPAISAVDGRPGLFLASGFSGHGFGIGPGAGRLMADLVTGAKPCVDPTPFRYSRFVDGTRLVPFVLS